MFAFYDYNKDGLIGFAEFLQGLSYRKRKDKLRKVFEGYDIDGDGYVNRRDFLRMFRAYYVLYKQMHKDILDGLEDQLLTSTEAQQLIASRQPLSSLFGREGRVPRGDHGLTFEGKVLHRNGRVDLADGTEGAVAEDRGDTASRQDILASLFAYEPEANPRRRYASRDEERSQSRTATFMASDNTPYFITLMDYPTSLEDLPDAVMGDHTLDIEDDADDESNFENGDAEGIDGPGEEHTQPWLSESESRVRAVMYHRRRTAKMEKRRRDMARAQLHERWKRRQFYLDEEEGGAAPVDWHNDEDIFSDSEAPEDLKAGDDTPISRSSSKVRFADGLDDSETPSNPSTSTSIPDRWSGLDIPGSERDAGKEILYQVTQQAFNELLDTIFKAEEDIAVAARLTKQQREKYKDDIDAIELSGPDRDGQEVAAVSTRDKSPASKTLPELLEETGYTIAENQEPRNAVELGESATAAVMQEVNNTTAQDSNTTPDAGVSHEHCPDPTMPQYRPDSTSGDNTWWQDRVTYPITRPLPSQIETESAPDVETLRHWKRLTIAEKTAMERGGWGKLNFEEFEEIYRAQEYRGNRLDYLGSWIDFCIP
jgi:hypothetical protein